jgi:AraC-like DNA-binding protein
VDQNARKKSNGNRRARGTIPAWGRAARVAMTRPASACDRRRHASTLATVAESTPEIASRMAKRLIPVASKLGLDGPALCHASGIDRALLDDPHGRLPAERVLDFLDVLLTRADPAALGLLMATTAEPDAYHTPALVMLASDTLREGFTRAFELQRLWGDGDRFALVPAHALGAAGKFSAVTFRVPGPRRPAHEPLEVCALVETMLAVRGLTGRLEELPVDWGLPSLAGPCEPIEALFGQRPRLGVERAYVAISSEALDAALPTAHALYRAIFEKQATAELAALPEPDDFLARVRSFIARGLAAGSFGLDRCAQALSTSPRTLERRLAEAGTKYVAEVDGVRKSLATRFLREGRPIEEVAALLGYSERAALHRACVRWFGQTPAQVRTLAKQS